MHGQDKSRDRTLVGSGERRGGERREERRGEERRENEMKGE